MNSFRWVINYKIRVLSLKSINILLVLLCFRLNLSLLLITATILSLYYFFQPIFPSNHRIIWLKIFLIIVLWLWGLFLLLWLIWTLISLSFLFTLVCIYWIFYKCLNLSSERWISIILLQFSLQSIERTIIIGAEFLFLLICKLCQMILNLAYCSNIQSRKPLFILKYFSTFFKLLLQIFI